MNDRSETRSRGAEARTRHSRRLESAVLAALGVGGGASLAVQVLMLRELLAAWHGNEMSMGVVLSVWLLGGGLGAVFYGRITRRVRGSTAGPGVSGVVSGLAGALVALGALAPLSVLAARSARTVMGLSPAELVGFGPLMVSTAASILPFTTLAGFQFALGTSVLSRVAGRFSGAAGRIYVAEALGAAGAGLLVSLVLLERLNPVATAFLVSAVCCFSGAALVAAGGPGEARRGRPILAVALALAVASGLIGAGAAEKIDVATIAARWRGMGYVSHTDSRYARNVATSAGSQLSLYSSGVLVASTPDRLAAEESVHIPLLEHERPRDILMLGGGLGGAVAEILKHPDVRSVDYIELDPALIGMARQTFGNEMTQGLGDPRVELHFGDARFFVKRTDRSYDVVILGAPDPETAQLNRFYTVQAMEEIARVLRPEGLVGLTVSSTVNYITDEQAEFLGSLKATMEEVFTSLIILPGDPCHMVASPSRGSLTRDAETLIERVRDRELDVVFTREYYLRDRLAPERILEIDRAVDAAEARVNSDLLPVGYYLRLVVWQREFSGSASFLSLARRLAGMDTVLVCALLVAVLLGVSALRGAPRGGPMTLGVYSAVFIVGATEISLELAALLAFQSIYGYVYHQLALIVAGFMAGLALGGRAGVWASRRGAGLSLFAGIQAGITVVPLALSAAITGIAGLPPDALGSWATFFPLLVVGSALLAGTQFPVAVHLLSSSRFEVGSVAGRLYGADLAGAALGAPLTAIVMLPIMGIAGSMVALSAVNAALLPCLVILLLRARADTET